MVHPAPSTIGDIMFTKSFKAIGTTATASLSVITTSATALDNLAHAANNYSLIAREKSQFQLDKERIINQANIKHFERQLAALEEKGLEATRENLSDLEL